MAVGPLTSDQIDTATLLNVPAPLAPNTLMGGLSTSQVPGSQIGYVPGFQSGSPYSATNLPEFMKGYEQTPSGRFAMSQGLLGMAPDVANIQSLFSKDYGQEYDPLEQKFQESFAFDPSMFGNMYRAGGFIPAQVPGFEVQEDKFNPAQAIAGAGALAAVYPYGEDLFNFVTDPVSGEVKKAEEGLGYEFEERVTSPIKKGIIDPVVTAYKDSEFKQSVDKWFNKPEWLNTMQEEGKDLLSSIKNNPLVMGLKVGADAVGNIQNLIDNPNAQNAFAAMDSIDAVNSAFPGVTDFFKVPDSWTQPIASVAGAAGIADAIKDPTPTKIAQAYNSADEILAVAASKNIISADPTKDILPKASSVGNVASVLGGVEALKGGIESPGEAAAVISGATAAAKLAGVDLANTAAGSALAGAGSLLGPITAAIALEDILAEDLSIKDILQGLPIVGRAFGGGGSTFGRAELGYKGDDFAFIDEASKNKGWVYTMPELHTTNLVLNELTDNLGFKVDQSKLKGIDQTIDINNGNVNRGANDIVIDMIEKGALIPTESTPNNIDWGGLFTDAREYSKGRHNEQTLPFTTVSQIREDKQAKAQAYKGWGGGLITPEAVKKMADYAAMYPLGGTSNAQVTPQTTTPTSFVDPFQQALSKSLGNLDFSNLKIDQAAIAEGLKNLDFSTIAKPEPKPEPKPAPVVIPNLNIQPIDLSNLKLPDFSTFGFGPYSL